MTGLRLKAHSVAPVKLPTEFAELNADLTTYQKNYIDCSGCENIGAPDSVIETISEAIKRHPELIWDHWNPQDSNIRKKIANLHNVDVGQVFITSGAIAGIDYCFKIFAAPGTKTGLIKPDWPGFDHYVDFYKNQKFYLQNFEFPFSSNTEQISAFVKDNALDMMIFANPTPVQGHLLEANEVERILLDNPRTLFIVDEADTISPEKQAAFLASKYDNAVFLGSLSKFYGLSGLRIGYLISPKMHCQHFRNTINVIEVSSLAILAGNIVLGDNAYQVQTKRNVNASLETLRKSFQGTPYRIAGNEHCFASYIYSQASNPKTDLEKFKIKILEGQFFGLPDRIGGGRFNLSNPNHSLLVASSIGELAKVMV